MKQFIILLFLFVGCTVDDYKNTPEWAPKFKQIEDIKFNFFNGSHKLLSLNNYVRNETHEKSTGVFILIGGMYDSEKTQKYYKYVNFTWLNNNGEYVLSELPYNKVKLIIDDNINAPYCKFVWGDRENYVYADFCSDDRFIFAENVWGDYVRYVIFYIKSNQIKNEIKLDLTK
jgi:hypothetical protein